jgi:hypothetical protein
MAKLTDSQRIGDRSSVKAVEMLVDAGCAVNSLERSDVGFDLHVALPVSYPEPGRQSWEISPSAVLIQVKGGSEVNKGVRLPRQRWAEYLTQDAATYIAAIPTNAQPWIESVYALFPHDLSIHSGKRPVGRPDIPCWDPQTFVRDALVHAALPTPGDRLWWRRQLPAVDDHDEAQALQILSAISELGIFHAGANGGEIDPEEVELFASRLVDDSPLTKELLVDQGYYDGISIAGLDFDSSSLMADWTLAASALDDVSRLAAIERSVGSVAALWDLVELRLANR